MQDEVVYVLDANVFIEAKRRYYAFDFAPRFWTSLVEQARNGQIESIDKIKEELNKGKDELSDWADSEFIDFFASTDYVAVTTQYGELMVWVNDNSQYYDTAKSKYANDPDGWLIAYSCVKKRVLVTEEVSDLNTHTKVKIPDVCLPFSVTCIDTFELIRRLGIKWE